MSNVYKTANKRSALMQTLARQWVKFHRPDVWEIIKDEAFKIYPSETKRNMKTPLPTTLRDLK